MKFLVSQLLYFWQDRHSRINVLSLSRFLALLVGLIATMSGIWMGYWHGAPLAIVDGAFAAPEADQLSLHLVVFGTVTTILGGFGIYRSQDM